MNIQYGVEGDDEPHVIKYGGSKLDLAKELDIIREEQKELEKKEQIRKQACCFCLNVDMGFSILFILEFFDIVFYTISFVTLMIGGSGKDDPSIMDEFRK